MPTNTIAPTILTDLIDDSERVRKNYGDLTALAESIQSIGLIHPVVISDTVDASGHYTLVAGGRRLATFRALGLTEIPYNFRSVADQADLRECELEENLQREDMTWQEKVEGIMHVHELRLAKVGFDNSRWGLRHTAKLLGLKSQVSISNALTVGRALRANDTEVIACDSMTSALQLLLGRSEARAIKRLGEIESITKAPLNVPSIDPGGNLIVDFSSPTSGSTNEQDTKPNFVWNDTNIDLTNTVIHADSLPWMATHPACCDHIITDPPYGIEMKNLGTFTDIDRVEAEHDVDENLDLLQRFYVVAYSCLKDTGFCITWCDMQHFEKLLSFATDAGFRAQRWPIVWIKSHSCINNAAQYNFTKDTEVALVCRKGNATLTKPQPTSVITANGATERKMYRNPFAKPFAIWQFLFDAVAIPGQTILDPFAGEGSMPSAAINCGLRPICLEKSETHYPALVENVKKAYSLVTRGKAVFS